SGEVVVSALGREIRLPVTVESADVPSVRFVRDVQPVLAKLGCNAGTCHGSASGKNGFKLSLRGYDPDFDYHALINDISGRRFNRVHPDDSLMLLKPLAEVPHEGRQVIKPGSREYKLLRDWIAEGTRNEDANAARATSIEILPGDVEMDLPGRDQQLLVIATYPDGTTRDVTRDAHFSVSNTEVAKTGADGVVKGLRRGEAAILVRYEGIYGTRLLTIMGDRSGYEWKEVAENNFIDKHVNDKLRRVQALPSELCTDAEFIRRVSLDLTGLPPKADRVRAFLLDTTAAKEKREKLIDELIGSPDYVKSWANKWADLLQCNSENLGQKGVWVYRQWIEKRIAENMPYDKFVRELLLAEGSAYQNPAVNYFRVLKEPGKITEDVSQTFLGVRFNCNKCHDHPFEKWTQNQYYEFGAHFARVAFKKGALPGEEIVYRNYNGGEVKHLKTDMVVAPKVPFGSEREIKGDDDRRDPFVDWLTSKENPLFAKSMANRVWSYFFGKGVIDPVDDIRGGNPPSNPALLDALTAEFIKTNFDLRALMRTICQSRTYQLSIIPNKWNEDDTINFSHASPRRLSAEQMLDAVAVATGVRPQFSGMPVGMRPVEIPDGIVQGNDFLALFGRPKRQSACECERTSNMTLSHTLNLINGQMLSQAVNSPKSRIAKLVESEADNQKLIEEIYLACLNRFPTEKEIAALDFVAAKSRSELAQDLTWALMNSSAFVFNR
ncbi:MAG TPA: DUF1549 domain-containing protein, partial [Methylomirabilota bacterium]|nr:DUF1549 domain-containing protein [Methylomirabilota bacterium]